MQGERESESESAGAVGGGGGDDRSAGWAVGVTELFRCKVSVGPPVSAGSRWVEGADKG